MRKIFAVIFSFLFYYCGIISAQTTVQIGSGTLTTANAPYNGSYNYSWAHMIFLQTEIGNSGTISSIQFQVASVTGPYTMTNQLIYAKLSTTSSLSGGTYPGTAGFTQIFNSSITYSATGW